MGFRRQIFAVILGVLSVLLTCLNGRAADEIRGSVSAQTLDGSGVAVHDFRATFSVYVLSNSWRIQVEYGTHFVETCSYVDGEFRSVLHFSESEFPNKDGMHKNATITPWPYPLQSEPITRLIWLAFVPDKSLVTEGRSLPAIWNMPFENPRSHFLECTNVSWLDEAFGRVSRLDFCERVVDLEALRHDRLLSLQVPDSGIKKAVKSLTPGFIEGTFTVNGSTNCDGRVYPLSFSLGVFALKQEKAMQLQAYRGFVEHIEVSDRPLETPSAFGKVTVNDYRFYDASSGVDAITYVITNDQWLSESDPRLQNLFADKKARSDYQPGRVESESKGSSKTVTYVVIAFALGSLCILFLVVKSKFGSKK